MTSSKQTLKERVAEAAAQGIRTFAATTTGADMLGADARVLVMEDGRTVQVECRDEELTVLEFTVRELLAP